MAVTLTEIVPWGRCRSEYELMFDLQAGDLTGGVLDCGGGPASFTAEITEAGFFAVSADPLYVHPGAAIQARFEAVVEDMMAQVRATPDDWTWNYHLSPEDLCSTRRRALEKFLRDYEAGLRAGRYVVAEIPNLPFESDSFGLALSSHFLFLYSDLLSEDFHIRSILELCRVAREVRLFPLLTLQCRPSSHVEPVCSALDAAGYRCKIVRVDYELQRGGNQMLKVCRRQNACA